jgi:hypothetical protein
MKYDCIIRGATFYGCNVLVLEESVVPGSDWALCFDAGNWEETLVTKPALDFKEALLSHKALDEKGRLCIAALAPLMSQWCVSNGVRIEFSCNFISHEDGVVKVIGIEGPRQYETSHFIDARPRILNGRKRITGLMLHEGQPLDMGAYGDFMLTPSIVEGEYYLALTIPSAMKWPEARIAFHTAWDKRPAPLGDGQLQLIGVNFSYGNAPNPAAAIEYGYLLTKDVLKK